MNILTVLLSVFLLANCSHVSDCFRGDTKMKIATGANLIAGAADAHKTYNNIHNKGHRELNPIARPFMGSYISTQTYALAGTALVGTTACWLKSHGMKNAWTIPAATAVIRGGVAVVQW